MAQWHQLLNPSLAQRSGARTAAARRHVSQETAAHYQPRTAQGARAELAATDSATRMSRLRGQGVSTRPLHV